MKKLVLTIFLCLASSCLYAQTVTFDVTAADLQNSSGALLPTNGLVMLVASTTNSSFGGPTATSFVSGDDIILKKWDLSAFGVDGVLIDTTSALALSGSWNAGDPLQLYWYPTLTLDSLAPGAGTSYGEYTDALGIDGSAPWLTPSSGATVDLVFLTSDEGGSNPQSAGLADLFTPGALIPEPSSFVLIGLGLALGWVCRRRAAIR